MEGAATKIKRQVNPGVDLRSVREGGLGVPEMGRPKDCRLCPRNQQQQQAAQEELARSASPECLFARGLLSTLGQPYKKTRYGPFASWIHYLPVRNYATTFLGCTESSRSGIF